MEVVEPSGDATGVSPSSLGKLVPGHLSSVQQSQLEQLPEVHGGMFSRDKDDIDQTPVLEHTIETQGPPVRLPYHQRSSTSGGRRPSRSSRCWKVALFTSLIVRGCHQSSWCRKKMASYVFSGLLADKCCYCQGCAPSATD